MPALAIAIIAAGAILMVGACAYALLRAPRASDLDVPENDTIAFVPEGPPDGQVVRIEGRVVADRPLTSATGRKVAFYELYASDADGAARPLRRRGVPFFVHDGKMVVRIDPGFDLAAFDLPTATVDALDGGNSGYVERRLDVGARVQVVGRVLRFGAPGHEEFSLLPADGNTGVALTFLAPPRSVAAPTVVVENRPAHRMA
jgi:hypothetical protein